MSAVDLLAAVDDVGRDRRRGGWSRHLGDDAETTLREWFTTEAARRGLAVETDTNTNLWAWWGDPEAGDAVVTGSHLDSVPGGGAYDGPLGVASGLAALDLLRARGHRPTRPIAVAVFAEEEGGRFGVPCLGSRLLTGALDPDRARALRDADGVTLAEVYARRGHDPARLGHDPARLGRLARFVELHIEQGRALAPQDLAIGVGSTIVAHGRWRLSFTGRADHAGTTELADRRDPMLPAAETVLAARRAMARDPQARATVGRVHARPGGTNIVPSAVEVWLDARGPAPQALVEDVVAAARAAAGAEGCRVEVTTDSVSPAVRLDAGLADTLTRVAAATVPEVVRLATGAGHDAGVLAAHLPTGMLHVRNPTGTSHAPDEHAEDDDVATGVRVLADVLADLTR
ncbi:allantoate amidohydrolase [Actinomycetospora cinnamomea]|uniref:N-carbamoyl-L-amino-acid hydrolase n=1 Tax=Actinomycetospora cinnamomea TaxID=663609 RepID=A0A2U1EZG7_9PSEU|nr:allantoate amidohydrolase [Actinomycetospora cinnamomea]PVZ05333.1 N-carbamoyl-L-amino-acid hydrolase [Actinomycetospora cinnamomea]